MLTNLSVKITKPNIKIIQSASKKHILAQNMGKPDKARSDKNKFLVVNGVELF